MSQEPSDREGSRPVVMSARDLGLSQRGTYLKKPWVGGRQKGAYTSNRKDWETVKVFQEPAFRIPLVMAAHSPGRRKEAPIPPIPWVEAAIRAGLVETASPRRALPVGEFFSPLDGQDRLPYCSREDLLRQLKEGIEDTLREWEKE